MLIKKPDAFNISALAFVVLLWNTKVDQADESSKLLNNATIQKNCQKKGTLNVGVKRMSQTLVTTQPKTNTIRYGN